jgi:hypothetical protein
MANALLERINNATAAYADLFEEGVLNPTADMQDVTSAASEMFAILERIARFLEAT